MHTSQSALCICWRHLSWGVKPDPTAFTHQKKKVFEWVFWISKFIGPLCGWSYSRIFTSDSPFPDRQWTSPFPPRCILDHSTSFLGNAHGFEHLLHSASTSDLCIPSFFQSRHSDHPLWFSYPEVTIRKSSNPPDFHTPGLGICPCSVCHRLLAIWGRQWQGLYEWFETIWFF